MSPSFICSGASTFASTLQGQVHFLRINKGYMPHVISTNRQLFSGRLNSFGIVISIITTIPKIQKAHNICYVYQAVDQDVRKSPLNLRRKKFIT